MAIVQGFGAPDRGVFFRRPPLVRSRRPLERPLSPFPGRDAHDFLSRTTSSDFHPFHRAGEAQQRLSSHQRAAFFFERAAKTVFSF